MKHCTGRRILYFLFLGADTLLHKLIYIRVYNLLEQEQRAIIYYTDIQSYAVGFLGPALINQNIWSVHTVLLDSPHALNVSCIFKLYCILFPFQIHSYFLNWNQIHVKPYISVAVTYMGLNPLRTAWLHSTHTTQHATQICDSFSRVSVCLSLFSS